MAKQNWTHLFIDGRRVSFDRRDGSVTLFPDDGFRLLCAECIGYAEGSGSRWTATAPDGATYSARGRKDAATWLLGETADDRARRASQRAQQAAIGDDANETAASIIRTVWPDFQKPGPLMGNRDAPAYYTLSPEEMRDLLLALTSEGPREIPLTAALSRVVEHEVVLFNVGDPSTEPHPFEWGFLEAVAVVDAPDDRPDLGTYAEFHFERGDGHSSMIGLPGLAPTALASPDAVVIDEEGGTLVIVIAEPASETLNVPGTGEAWEWDREWIIELAQREPPALDEPEEDDAASGASST